jgi:putative molybdopterin biosynthesis protein
MTRKRYLRKKSLEEALRVFLKEFPPGAHPRVEEVSAVQALGRIAALPAEARICSPSYHAASMDGYAVEARTTFTARENRPLDLEIGAEAHGVDTGDPLPAGTDAVIMVEDVHYPEERLIRIYRSLSPYENVRLMGEDIVAGEMILPAGKEITPFDIGLCLAAGLSKVAVRPKPRVAIIPTGDELVPPGTPPGAGRIIEFNSSILAGMVREKGGEAVVWPIIPDDPEKITEAVTSALKETDVAVISAGSSAGRDDHTADVIQGLGELLVHGVSIVPGKPTALGIIGGRPVIGLPGYPASAIISFQKFVLPLIDRLLGREEAEEVFKALLSRDIPSRPGHVEFLRGQAGRVRERLVFNPLPRGASLISSFARANALAEIPAETEGVERGETVHVRLLASRTGMERNLLLAGSHDLCLDILRDELLVPPGQINLLVSTQGSLGGLLLLAEDYAHLATCHLLDPETGLYNRPFIHRFLPGREVRLLHVAGREQGLMVIKGNHKGIRGLADLAREDVTFVNRQRGSGTRILLDHLLGEKEIDPAGIRGYQREEVNHLTVAAAVSSGLADAGLGILPAASALGLDFIPLAEEMFDLVIPEENLESKGAVRLMEVVASRSFQKRLEEMGGYDTSVSGVLD